MAVFSTEGDKSTGLVSSDDYLYLPSYKELANVTSDPYGGEAIGVIPWFVADQDSAGHSYTANMSRAKWRGQIIRPDRQIINSQSDPTMSEIEVIHEGDIWCNNGGNCYMFFTNETISKHRFIGQSVTAGGTSVIAAADGSGSWLIATYWWERSPYATYTTSFMNVSTNGNAGNSYGASIAYALPLCFSL